MTDLEIVKKCAEAMGYSWSERDQGLNLPLWLDRESRNAASNPTGDYDPLHDDAQAMALVKRFDLCITRGGTTIHSPWWSVHAIGRRRQAEVNPDLNRAICECVAKMEIK